jgi:tartrate dehydrogenase/decarboxylase / D-malate dehydrogenase
VRGATEHRARSYNIAAIPGDGIGQEVLAAAVEVLLACAERDKGFAFTNFDWGSERYKKFGALMPADGIETLKQFDATHVF